MKISPPKEKSGHQEPRNDEGPQHPQQHADGRPLKAARQEIAFTRQLQRPSVVFVLGKNVKILASEEDATPWL